MPMVAPHVRTIVDTNASARMVGLSRRLGDPRPRRGTCLLDPHAPERSGEWPSARCAVEGTL